jgi:hypothetical protein
MRVYMPIRLPLERTYYPASRDEPEQLLCWIPPHELEALIKAGRAPARLRDEHPLGLELEVSAHALSQAGIELPAPADSLKAAYLKLRNERRLPASGYVQATYLEQGTRDNHAPLITAAADMIAEPEGVLPSGLAPEPAMSAGEEPDAAMRRLARLAEE